MESTTVAAAATPQETPCATCELMRNDGNRQYQLFKSLLAREKAVKEREEAQNSFDAELTRLRSEIEELKKHGVTAAPVAGKGKKRRLEEDEVTQGPSEKEQKLEAEIKALQAEKYELQAKYDTSKADLRAATSAQYNANKEMKKLLAESEKKASDESKKGYDKGLERGREEVRAQMIRAAQRNDNLQAQNAQNEAIASFRRQADLDKKALEDMRQKALEECQKQYQNGLEAGKQEAQARINCMAQGNNDLQAQSRQYEATIAGYQDNIRQYEATIARFDGRIRQHEQDLASYENNISQLEQRAITAEGTVSRLAGELREEKQGKSTTEQQTATLKKNLAGEKMNRESAESLVASLKRELEAEKSQRDAARKEVSNLKGHLEREKRDKETAEASIINLKADLDAGKDATAEEKKLRAQDIEELVTVLGTNAKNMSDLRQDIQKMKDMKAASVQDEDIRALMKIIGTEAVNMSDVREGVRAMVEKAKKADKLHDVDVASLSKVLGTESKSMSEIHKDILVIMAKGKKVDVLGRNLQSLAKLLGTRPHTFDVRNAVVDLINKENAVANGQYVKISTVANQLGTSSTTITQIQKDIRKLVDEAGQVIGLQTTKNNLIAEVYRQKGRYADLQKEHNELLSQAHTKMEVQEEVGVEKAKKFEKAEKVDNVEKVEKFEKVVKVMKQKRILPKQLGEFGGMLWFLGGTYLLACMFSSLAGLA